MELLYQYYISSIWDKVFHFISKELNVNGKICEILEKYSEYTNKHRKLIEKEYDSQFKDYRENDEEERTKHIHKELNKIPKHKKLQKLNLNDVLMDFDATSLYSSTMWDEISVYPEIETRFAFRLHMNKTYVDAFNDQIFNEDGNESVILRIKYYNPPNLISQHLPFEETVRNIEVNRMRNGYIINTLASVDLQEIVKIGGKVIEIYSNL